jgi:hypothetical protein
MACALLAALSLRPPPVVAANFDPGALSDLDGRFAAFWPRRWVSPERSY